MGCLTISKISKKWFEIAPVVEHLVWCKMHTNASKMQQNFKIPPLPFSYVRVNVRDDVYDDDY